MLRCKQWIHSKGCNVFNIRWNFLHYFVPSNARNFTTFALQRIVGTVFAVKGRCIPSTLSLLNVLKKGEVYCTCLYVPQIEHIIQRYLHFIIPRHYLLFQEIFWRKKAKFLKIYIQESIFVNYLLLIIYKISFLQGTDTKWIRYHLYNHLFEEVFVLNRKKN